MKHLEALASPAIVFEGPLGGPFQAENHAVTLRNGGASACTWRAVPSVPWIRLPIAEGNLAAGAQCELEIELVPAAVNALAATSHPARIAFFEAGREEPALVGLLVTIDGPGWTSFAASADSRVVYVSSSTGNDARDGLRVTTPKRTLAAGKALMRSGYPDQLLLKRGDRWSEPIGQWIASGRSAAERIVIGAYGDGGERPIVDSGKENGIATFQGGASPTSLAHVALVGIHFQASAYRGDGDCSGIAWLLGTDDFLVEDCLIEGYHTNVLMQGYFGRHKNFQLRRCVIVDAFSTGTESSGHGLYMSNCDGALIEENVFDHNGWSETVAGAKPSVFRHNIYVQSGPGTCTEVVVRKNVIAQAASHGLQLRPGGVAQDNLFLRNSIALMLGGGNEPTEGGVTAFGVGNCILGAKDIDADNRRGWGIEVYNIACGVLDGNVIAQRGEGGFALPLDMHADKNGIGIFDCAVTRNVVDDWGGSIQFQGSSERFRRVAFVGNWVEDDISDAPLVCYLDASSAAAIHSRDNRFHAQKAPAEGLFIAGGTRLSFDEWRARVDDSGSSLGPASNPQPRRTIEQYHEKIAGAPTLRAFLDGARGQSKARWRAEYTAPAVIDWIRSGYAPR